MRAIIPTSCFIAAALVAPALCTSCANSRPQPSPAASASAQPATDPETGVSVGERVVIEVSRGNFWQGKVVKLEGHRFYYEYGGAHSISETDRGQVFRFSGVPKPVANPGDYVVCRTGTDTWDSCQVKSVNGDGWVATDTGGNQKTLGPQDLIAPGEPARTHAMERVVVETKHREFLASAHAAGKPFVPKGWKPKVGDFVVALFGGQTWWGGKIDRLHGDVAFILWDDRSSPSERTFDAIAPKPSGPAKAKVGQFVLVRPATVKSTKWDYVKVTSVSGTTFEVIDQDNLARTAGGADIIPIVP